MNTQQGLCLGVVAEDSLQLHRLRSAITDFGCDVLTLSPDAFKLKAMEEYQVGAWLVDLRDDDELLDTFLDTDTPVLLGFEAAPSQQNEAYPRWEKRLYGKLKSMLGKDFVQPMPDLTAVSLQKTVESLPLPASLSQIPTTLQHVWILGSSLGGPEAVKEFLDALPKGLPVAFIYGQHIDQQFVPVLAQVLGRHAHFKLQVAEEGLGLNNGEVLIVPAEHEIEFQQGRVHCLQRPWPGPYGPSVDQLMLNSVASFPQAGVILFSGMGNDGAEAAQVLAEKGTVIWAQSSESCASAAMPDAARETGAVSYSGTPQELAKHLVEHIEAQQTQALTG